MNAVEASDDDIIYLNVGSQKLATTRSTLCQVEGSFIASMFNGHWDSNHKRDQDGTVFLDYNPQYFVPILNFLQAKTFATRETQKFQKFCPVPWLERRNLPHREIQSTQPWS